MKNSKLNVATITGKLSRSEMKNIMAGNFPPDDTGRCGPNCDLPCTFKDGSPGTCRYNSDKSKCHCVSGS